MLIAVCALLIVTIFLTRREKGPIWAACLSWLLCITPIALGLIDYEFFEVNDPRLPIVIIASVACFVGGVLLTRTIKIDTRATSKSRELTRADMLSTQHIASACWVIGVFGCIMIFVDFALYGGAAAGSIAELRETYVLKGTASVFAKVGSILTWACLYCYGYALVFRRTMSRGQFIVYAFPVVTYLLSGLASAGRQAAFQVFLVTILAELIARARSGRKSSGGGRAFVAVISALMIGYMGFIAVARNDNAISYVRSEVLERLFQCQTSPVLDTIIQPLGPNVSSAVIEGILYFSSSIAYFQKYLNTGLFGVAYGGMDFPFFVRQLEPITGFSVENIYEIKIASMESQGVIGVGWTSAVSSMIMDFGYLGAGIFLAIQGLISGYAWKRAISSGDFHDIVIAIVMMIAAIYLPLLPALSDNNMLFLLLFCIAIKVLTRNPRQRAARVAAAVPGPHPSDGA